MISFSDTWINLTIPITLTRSGPWFWLDHDQALLSRWDLIQELCLNPFKYVYVWKPDCSHYSQGHFNCFSVLTLNQFRTKGQRKIGGYEPRISQSQEDCPNHKTTTAACWIHVLSCDHWVAKECAQVALDLESHGFASQHGKAVKFRINPFQMCLWHTLGIESYQSVLWHQAESLV